MGVGFLAFYLSVSLLLRCSASQQPNTDAFFVSDLFQKMGVAPSSINGNSSEVCSWQGVSCEGQTEKVVSLVASGLGLSGRIPDTTIGKLSKLRVLDLSDNNITALPSDFGELCASLSSLNLSSNNIAGALPSNIGNFERMETLDLSRNRFSGEIPREVGSLSTLMVLNLSRNLLEMVIPETILGCASLVSLDVSNNRLNGSVPDGFGATFKNLSILDLSENGISGKMPDLSGLHSVTYLNLSGNLFRDLVLGGFRAPLQVVDLSRNQFHGLVSQVNRSSTSNWSSLVYLDMSMNELTGEFFPGLGDLKSLKHLNLAFNKFSSQELIQIEIPSSLQYLNLSKTNLTGQIPTGISHLISLEVLDLSQNHIIGTIPELQTGNLKVIDLSLNNLTGEIPESLQQNLSSMEKFNFSFNNLTYCAEKFSTTVLNSSFIGSQSDCPIAVNPDGIESNGKKPMNLKLGFAIAFSVFFLLAGLFCLTLTCRKRTKSWAVKQPSYKEELSASGPFYFQTDSTTWVADVKLATTVPVVIFEKPLLNFTFADLLNATSHFDRGTLLAEGRFGPVYRGFLPGGIHVAVKVLVHGSTVTDQEAAQELERLGQIKHPNLVPLTGYCLAGDQRIAIYDYMENGNLQNLLHDLPLGVQSTEDWTSDTWEQDTAGIQSITTEGMTTWRFRHKIALGAARALAFLHHGCFPLIVHRDVKASSIYLDSSLEPRLADFGLSSLVGASMEGGISQGSSGYTPPEFSEPENAAATTKSDVYGFGVVLFELLTGKKPVGDEYGENKETTLVSWARALVRRNELARLMDPKIRETGPEKQMEEALRVAYLCTADLPSKRPSMQQIVGLLKDIEPAIIEL
ncbi:putative LRR receptor-like serine/threonine-protein kinase [Canna indica]|uniref:LRR receptor-like serine/threonine-protein kinase n=1 Tax=Canna indica TaxID=4628 RepID=A0AAQ3Q5A3_9LILI|nr:putative LRR receptor-like serine/threonine-protein kinase [Canna indica]